MVSSRCIPIALGTDIGGSIRIPALFNGIVGFKPTGGRISQEGILMPTKSGYVSGTQHNRTCPGPLAQSVQDCTSFFKLMCHPGKQNLTDPLIAPVPFNQDMYESIHADHSKIKVGV